MMNPAQDPILRRFRSGLESAYGDRIARVLLFGSQARGDARADADYDVAVFLKGHSAFGADAGILAEIETQILLDTGAVINALPLPASADGEATAFASELRRDGLEL